MYSFREITKTEEWDGLIREYGRENPYQLWRFGESTAVLGGHCKRFALFSSATPVLIAQVTRQKLFYGDNNFYLSIRQGPVIIGDSYRELIPYFLSRVSGNRDFRGEAAALTLESNHPYDPGLAGALIEAGFLKSSGIQSHLTKGTIVLDLEPDNSALMSQMSKTTVRYIRSGARKGVIVRKSKSPNDFEIFWRLSATTAQRKPYTLFPRPWYEAVYKADDLDTELFLVASDGMTIAATLVLYHANTAFYLWGGSKPIPGVSGLRLALWEAIQEAKRRGMAKFDLMGIDEEYAPGLARFKRSFGGQEVNYIGCYDYLFT